MVPAPTLLPVADTDDRPARSDGRHGLTPDGKIFATVSLRGFYQAGTTTIAQWLDSLDRPPPGSPSMIRVLKAVSVNEGNFEAINSYDLAFLSCGILQWTAGTGSDPGELAYLLSVLKTDDRRTFDDCFARYGLDVSAANFAGQLSIDGRQLRSPEDKAALRDVRWAYRFWRAAHAPAVRLAQFKVASGRIARFSGDAVEGYALTAWITSERGVAHLLDEHVNRPGHVPATLQQAVKQLYPGPVPDPSTLDGAAETRLIQAYLDLRVDFGPKPMTDSEKRAARIDASVSQGALSSARGSYQSLEV